MLKQRDWVQCSKVNYKWAVPPVCQHRSRCRTRAPTNLRLFKSQMRWQIFLKCTLLRIWLRTRNKKTLIRISDLLRSSQQVVCSTFSVATWTACTVWSLATRRIPTLRSRCCWEADDLPQSWALSKTRVLICPHRVASHHATLRPHSNRSSLWNHYHQQLHRPILSSNFPY